MFLLSDYIPCLVCLVGQFANVSRYRCAAGGEWKSITEFAKNQQKKITGRGRVDAANTGMICKEHNQAQIKLERTCEHCFLTKPLSEFSGRSISHEEFVGSQAK